MTRWLCNLLGYSLIYAVSTAVLTFLFFYITVPLIGTGSDKWGTALLLINSCFIAGLVLSIPITLAIQQRIWKRIQG
jgi:hypothetical protein